uniref:Uncharacterized protein n=1 Tax=Arundo donax TaxID=35708 RepID=A0A0A9EY06_ARUDO
MATAQILNVHLGTRHWTACSEHQQLHRQLNSLHHKFLCQLKPMDLLLPLAQAQPSRVFHVITFRKACVQKGTGVPSRMCHRLLEILLHSRQRRFLLLLCSLNPN